MDNFIARCADAVSRIDNYLLSHQKSGAYDRWLERYAKRPSQHDDAFLFGKLIQAIFSGGMKGQVVDDWIPRMEKAFHGWDVHSIVQFSDSELEMLAASGAVIANRPKLKAVVSNAKTVVDLISRYGSFGRYLASFEHISALSEDLSGRFSFLGPVTTEDFLRNIGFDTAKPDRHLTRWLTRMQAIDSGATLDQVLEATRAIADAANLSKARFDAAIYLFCADRDDVIPAGLCGNNPKCAACPISDLCFQDMTPQIAEPSQTIVPRAQPRRGEGPVLDSLGKKSKPNTV
jgi:3-methyladenine DNA glycosylase Tag